MSNPLEPLPDLETIVARVADHDPRRLHAGTRGFHAATALVLGDTGTIPRMLVIRRATRHGDPWSGHAALPGGKQDAGDPDLLATAVRETHEEVGLALDQPVGRLDDIGGRSHFGVVSTFVFRVVGTPATTPQPSEVAEALWVPLDVLTDPDAAVRHPNRRLGPWPAWEYESLTIWGLTHRILTGFLGIVGSR